MLALWFAVLLPQSPTPAPGIAHDLAQARAAAIADLHYRLAFALDAPVARVRGRVEMTFVLREPPGEAPLVLDFGGEDPADLRVNGADVPVATVADHLLLPAAALRAGANTVAMTFASPVTATGTPLCVYRDPADGKEYCYTLLVPADAHRLFPCFDQPDLKARFLLQLDLPAEWTAIGNGEAAAGEQAAGRRRWTFAESAPLPTYLFAFACGPYDVIDAMLPRAPGLAQGRPMHILLRPSQRALADAAALTKLHGEGLRWLCDWFGIDYPFGKLDIALIPGFPYGGMEHAGAIFYRERALVFDHPPTDGELVRRSTLVYHELSHQWFGNLVTMRWFDDLWLKEGFATFVAYRAMADLEPQRRAWLRFLQHVKPRAYEVDGTPGTTPVYQQLANLADAKSAYGAIVYNKAPAVLRELDERLGADAFRAGLHAFLDEHRFGNATWQDLARALESTAKVDLRRWSDRWLLAPSLPQVRVDWRVDADGRITAAELRQTPVAGSDTWPLHVELLVADRAGRWQRLAVDSDSPAQPIDALRGRTDVACIVANPGDVAYAQFLPDATSRAWISEHAADTDDALLRAVMVAALFEAVREAEHAPAAFCHTALGLLARETDPDTHGWVLELFGTCLLRYVDDRSAERLRAQAGELLLQQLAGPAEDGRKLQTFRFLMRHGAGPAVRVLGRAAVRGEPLPAGLTPGREDRFLALASLLAAAAAAAAGDAAAGDAAVDDPAALRDALVASCKGQDIGRELFLARAATATRAGKQEYFDLYLRADGPPEQWSQDSLPWFHWPGQHELTLPFLRPALERAQWAKQNRRIFFMPAWLDGFVNGHSDAAALATVDEFLRTAKLDDDVRKKLLQSRDGLQRAVRIRAAFPGDDAAAGARDHRR